MEIRRPRVAHARPAEQEQDAGDERPATPTRWTPTSRCPACSDIPRGQHTLRCRKRKANQQLTEERKALKVHLMEDIPIVPEQKTDDTDEEIFNAEEETDRATKRYGREERPGAMKRRRSARLAERRRRSDEAEEEQEAEEQMTRGTIDIVLKEKFEGKGAQEGLVEAEDPKHLIDPSAYMVGSIRRPPDTGPPWYDDVGGEPLEDDAVREAMKKSMEGPGEGGLRQPGCHHRWQSLGAHQEGGWPHEVPTGGATDQPRREDGHLRSNGKQHWSSSASRNICRTATSWRAMHPPHGRRLHRLPACSVEEQKADLHRATCVGG